MTERSLSLAATTAAAILYLATLSRWYSADSLLFAVAIDSDNPQHWIDPYHLLLHPLGVGWVRLWQAIGWDGYSIHALQALNALAGAGCVGVMASMALRITGCMRTAAVIAAGCTASGGLWLLSTEAEDVTLGLLPHLCAARLLLSVPAGGYPQATRAWGVGAAIGFATLAYATCGLLLGVAALVHWQGRAQPHWLRSLCWVIIGFVCLSLPVVAYVGVRMATSDHGALATAYRYLGRDEYGTVSVAALPRGSYAFLRMLVLYPGLGMNDETLRFLRGATTGQRVTFASAYAVVAILAALPIAWLWRSRRQVRELGQRLLTWAALFAAFAMWWVASDLEFWLPVAMAWWLALALAIGTSRTRAYVGAALASGLLLANGLGLILPHTRAEQNRPLQIAVQLAPQLAPGDQLLASPDVHLFLRYFAARDAEETHTWNLTERIAHARATSPAAGRVIVAGLQLDEEARVRWNARPVLEHLGGHVWEVTP